jgi:protein translocase SecG subunit
MIVFFFVALMIVGLVLLQEGKGGGLTGMSTGMDGVMGAKNPLRRMTAYLFVFFVLMCLGINWYFHESGSTSVPTGMEIPVAEIPAALETAAPVAPVAPETPAAE